MIDSQFIGGAGRIKRKAFCTPLHVLTSGSEFAPASHTVYITHYSCRLV
jgi:hypothetical protein